MSREDALVVRVTLYSANRVKYPMMRKRLLKLWREAKAEQQDPVAAWLSIINDPQKAQSYKQARGRGGFVRSKLAGGE